MKSSRELAPIPAEATPAEPSVTDAAASAESTPAVHPHVGGSFIRQPDGGLQRNPAHPELKQQLVRRPPTAA
jgi:hypothetical protein